MVEFKIELDENFVKTFGHKQIENYLEEFMEKIVIRLSAKDILKDLETVDLANDKAWQVSRNLAWQQEKHKYFA